ncbi:MAG: ABC transporter permease [Methanobacterium sp. BRmetb2]|nr:MAG: ABC transporter permease [Methanobacterium sp. BRmetb2]
MSYFSLILKNPFRNRTRTSLAIVGIAIGIATIVALGLITGGLKASTETTLKAGGAEITVLQNNSGQFMNGRIDENRVDEIKEISGVKDTAGILRAQVEVPGADFPLSLTGIKVEKLILANIDSVTGTKFSNGSQDEVIIGKTASETLNKGVGDTIVLFGKNFKITGIFETGSFIQDAGAYMSLDTLQNLTSREGEVSMIYVKITDNANITQVSKRIEDAYPNELTTTTAMAQASRINTGLSAIDTATWAISLLAIIIGGIGVINTMIMSVYERTREIGVLKAVGWKGRRILGMILGEAIVLTLIAGVVGTVMGIIAVEVLLSISPTTSFIEPVFSMDIFIRAFGIAFLVGVIGGLYPAYRASKLAPTEALRYE